MRRAKQRPAWLAELGTDLAAYRRLQAGYRSPAPPPLPGLEARLRQLQARGYGSRAKPFTKGLVRQGMTLEAAAELMTQAARDKLVVLVSGGWQVREAAS